MQKGAGLLADSNNGRIGNQLDKFIVSWSSEGADQVMSHVNEAFGGIDEELWK